MDHSGDVVAALLCWILYVVRYALLMVYMAVMLAAAISPAVRCIERHHPLPCSGWRPL